MELSVMAGCRGDGRGAAATAATSRNRRRGSFIAPSLSQRPPDASARPQSPGGAIAARVEPAGVEPAGSHTARTTIGSPGQHEDRAMRRREFIAGLGAAITGPIRTDAQELP